MAPVLGYWDTRGRCEEIRILLAFAGVEFEDKRYAMKSNMSREEIAGPWIVDKETLGLDFPNLPYWIDGDVKITQSLVILRHLGRKHDLIAKVEADRLRVELAEQQIHDLKEAFFKVMYDHANYEKSSVEFKNGLAKNFQRFETFLGDRNFVAGDYVTYVDFLVYNVLDMLQVYSEESFEELDVLKHYLERVATLPNVPEHLASDNFKRANVSSPMAVWGWHVD